MSGFGWFSCLRCCIDKVLWRYWARCWDNWLICWGFVNHGIRPVGGHRCCCLTCRVGRVDQLAISRCVDAQRLRNTINNIWSQCLNSGREVDIHFHVGPCRVRRILDGLAAVVNRSSRALVSCSSSIFPPQSLALSNLRDDGEKNDGQKETASLVHLIILNNKAGPGRVNLQAL